MTITTTPTDRALPAWAIDLIRDGVPADELRTNPRRGLFSELVRVSMAAQYRGMAQHDLASLILEAGQLGDQLRHLNGKSQSDRKIRELLDSAWEWGWKVRAGLLTHANDVNAHLIVPMADPGDPCRVWITEAELPFWAADLIRDGVPSDELRTHGSKALFAALLRLAMAAQEHGWTNDTFVTVTLETRHQLGDQLCHQNGKDRPEDKCRELVDYAWQKASDFRVVKVPDFGAGLAAEVEARVVRAVRIAEDANSTLTVEERAVLACVAGEVRRRGWIRVPLPRRELSDALGLGDRTVRTALDRLLAARHLLLTERPSTGVRRTPTVYELPPA